MITLFRRLARAAWGKLSDRAKFWIIACSILALVAGVAFASHKATAGIKDKAYEAREREREKEREQADAKIKQLEGQEAKALADVAALQVQVKTRDVLLAQADAETRAAQEVIRKEDDDYKADQNHINSPVDSAERVADICDRLRRNNVPNWARMCARLKAAYGVQ